MFNIRNYNASDYESIKTLYQQSELYGGQFDPARDAAEKLESITQKDPQAILVCESANEILGTVSLIEDGRVALLFRFAVQKSDIEKQVIQSLYDAAAAIFIERGHTQMLVYSPLEHNQLDQRHADLGMNKGGAYSCYWKTLTKD